MNKYGQFIMIFFLFQKIKILKKIFYQFDPKENNNNNLTSYLKNENY